MRQIINRLEKKIRQKECTDIDRNTGDGIGMRSYAFRTEDSE